MGRPSAANLFRLVLENAVMSKSERCEKPLDAAKAVRSSAKVPIATAGRGIVLESVLMMPKGMFAREKCESGGMESHDLPAILTIGEGMAELI